MQPERSRISTAGRATVPTPVAPRPLPARRLLLAAAALVGLAGLTRDTSAALLFATPAATTQAPLAAVYPTVRPLRGSGTVPRPATPPTATPDGAGDLSPSHPVPTQGWWPLLLVAPFLAAAGSAVAQVRAARRRSPFSPLRELAVGLPLPACLPVGPDADARGRRPELLMHPEVLHGRWALLGALGLLAPEVLQRCAEAFPAVAAADPALAVGPALAPLLAVHAALAAALGAVVPPPPAAEGLALPALVALLALATLPQPEAASPTLALAYAFGPAGAPSPRPAAAPHGSPRGPARSRHVLYGLFGLGAPEIAIILVTAGFVFGPRSLAELAKSAGKMAGELKDVPKQFQEGLSEGSKPAAGEGAAEPTPPAAAPAEKPKGPEQTL